MNDASQAAVKIPLNVLTGFLGSGKTTLLKRLLSSDAFANCAVLINELGEIALDHDLIDIVDHETVVLSNGCICCGIRSDLADALLDLNAKRNRGDVPAFDRVVVETTGLADPAPVLNTIIGHPQLHFHFRVATIVTTVDALHGLAQLRAHPESVRQVAVADRLVITKTDLADTRAVDDLHAALSDMNPSATVTTSDGTAQEADILVEEDVQASSGTREAKRWFAGRPSAGGDGLFGPDGKRLGPAHATRVTSVALTFEEPLDWAAFGVWLSMLLHCHGARILRMKGILNISGSSLPTVVHGVQHLMHPPTHLPRWPDDDHRSRLVLIGDLPSKEALQHSLQAFMTR
ncbi:CobW family GTP-binding protein [Castellaniella sp. S9]|uniref:CobW family GTP-binding protein n=1 Tax=Castellaniella sp. S9 TaxID=2993652 RepID=UPI0022B52034|nr:GTP-binding protein [Castellaniella sp. S9]